MQFDGSTLEARSVLWLEGGSQDEGWGRGLLLFSDQDLDCEALPENAPGLRSLWKKDPIQGEGSGLVIWLQWTDLDEETYSWEGRYIVGEAPVGDRSQRRAVVVPFEDGVPQLDRPGRHGAVEIRRLSQSDLQVELRSNELEGSYVARACGRAAR